MGKNVRNKETLICFKFHKKVDFSSECPRTYYRLYSEQEGNGPIHQCAKGAVLVIL